MDHNDLKAARVQAGKNLATFAGVKLVIFIGIAVALRKAGKLEVKNT